VRSRTSSRGQVEPFAATCQRVS